MSVWASAALIRFVAELLASRISAEVDVVPGNIIKRRKHRLAFSFSARG